MSCPRVHLALFAALAPVLFTTPARAADTLRAGSDVWKTDGASRVAFARNPIPAGFFCPGSRAFTGTVELTGRPLATHPPDALRGAVIPAVIPAADRRGPDCFDDRAHGRRARRVAAHVPCGAACWLAHGRCCVRRLVFAIRPCALPQRMDGR